MTLLPLALIAALMGHVALDGRPGPFGEAEVLDAETIRLDGRLYRLADIDAPEPGQVCLWKEKPYPCGEIAVGGLMDLTAAATVVCRILPGAEADARGAWPARCHADGYELSEGMVYTGWALADPATGGRLAAIEADAAAKPRGLWRGPFVKPWDWRSGVRLEEVE